MVVGVLPQEPVAQLPTRDVIESTTTSGMKGISIKTLKHSSRKNKPVNYKTTRKKGRCKSSSITRIEPNQRLIHEYYDRKPGHNLLIVGSSTGVNSVEQVAEDRLES